MQLMCLINSLVSASSEWWLSTRLVTRVLEETAKKKRALVKKLSWGRTMRVSQFFLLERACIQPPLVGRAYSTSR